MAGGPTRVRISKPVGKANINGSHPLAPYVCFFYYQVGFDGTGAFFYDAVTGLPGVGGSGFTRVDSDDSYDNGGYVLATDAAHKSNSTNFLGVAANQSSYPPSNNSLCTLVARMKLVAKPASQGAAMQFCDASGHGPFLGWNSSGNFGGGGAGSNGCRWNNADTVDHTGLWSTYGASWDAGGGFWVQYIDGNALGGGGTSVGSPNTSAITNVCIGHSNDAYNNFINCQIGFAAGFSKVLTPYEQQMFAANPWALLSSVPDATILQLLQSAGGAGVTGDAAWTEGQDIWAGAGSVNVAGNAAWIEAQDALAATGSVIISGAAAWTEGQDKWAITGSVIISGAAAWTEVQDSWVGSGQVGVVSGSAAWTEARDVWVGAGSILISGSAVWTETQDAWAIAGTVSQPAITATAAWTEGQDFWNIQGVSTATGGHFLPLTRKQIQAEQKRRRKERKAQEDEWRDKQIEAESLAAEIRSHLIPSKTITEVINEVQSAPDYDDDDEADIEALLLA